MPAQTDNKGRDNHEDAPEAARESWYALKVRSGQEYHVWEELRLDEGMETLFPVFGREGIDALSRCRPPDRDAILFPGYLLVRVALTPEMRKKIESADGASHLLNPSRPSPIPEHEISLVRHVMSLDRSPLLGEAPQKGRVAEIVEGPMEGVRGYVTWRNRHQARIATVPRFAGGRALEVVVPLKLIRVGDYDNGDKPYSPRSRGGRRVKRSREWQERRSQAA